MKRAKTSATSTPTQPDIMSKLNHIHHGLNQISGGLVSVMTKHKLSRAETLEWARTLHQLAKQLEAIVQ